MYKVLCSPIGGGPPESREYDSMQPVLADFERSCCPQNALVLVQLLHIYAGDDARSACLVYVG